jgi:hypothetical protein
MSGEAATEVKWRYFENEGAVYRRPSEYHEYGPVTHVWHGQEAGWVPYKGDGLKPVQWGEEIPSGPA